MDCRWFHREQIRNRLQLEGGQLHAQFRKLRRSVPPAIGF